MGSVIPRADAGRAGTFSFADFERKAQDLRRRAEAQAQSILADAQKKGRALQAEIRAEAETQRKKGYEAGLAEGRHAGREQAYEDARAAAIEAARTTLNQTVQALTAACQELEREKRGLLALAELGLIELAIAIATRVCKLQAAASPEVARANARVLVEAVAHHNDIELRLSPADHELLPDVAAELAQTVRGLGHVTVQPDAAIEPGGCVIRTREGAIDATIATQFDRIAAAICLSHAETTDEPRPPIAAGDVS